MKAKISNHHSENGQSLVEFGISLVMLLVLLAGVVDGGRALFTYMGLRDAAQEGALYGSINPTDTGGIESRVRNSSNLLADINTDAQIQVTHSGSACTGNGITVQVTYNNFRITMPFLGAILGRQTIPISVTVTDTILRPGCT